MALFKIATEDENGDRKIYKNPEDLAGLIYYVYNKSIYFDTYNLFPLDIDGIIHQMLYLQSRKGRQLSTRALHFILSYDTGGWEWQMVQGKVCESIATVLVAANTMGVNEYQCCAGVHDTETHRHIHFILNPVNCNDLKVLHYSAGQYMAFLKELALNLYGTFRIALAGVSYITEDGRMKYVDKEKYGHFLYENRSYSYEPMQ